MNEETNSPVASLESRVEAMGVADRLSLRNHVVDAEIGAFQQERGVSQRLRFNVVVELAETPDTSADDVDQILSYDRIAEAIAQELQAERLNLLETLAERIAARLLHEPQAARVFLRVEKLDRGPGDLGVEIVREGLGDIAVKPLPTADVVVMRPGQALPAISPLVICPDAAGITKPEAGQGETARRIALLSLEQAAWLIAGESGLPVVSSRTELDWAIRNGERVIWAPSKLVLDTSGSPEDVAPQALADWLQTLMS